MRWRIMANLIEASQVHQYFTRDMLTPQWALASQVDEVIFEAGLIQTVGGRWQAGPRTHAWIVLWLHGYG